MISLDFHGLILRVQFCAVRYLLSKIARHKLYHGKPCSNGGFIRII